MGSHLSFRWSIFLGLLLFLLFWMQASTQPSKPQSDISFSQKSSQIFYSLISFKKLPPKAYDIGVSSQGRKASTVNKDHLLVHPELILLREGSQASLSSAVSSHGNPHKWRAQGAFQQESGAWRSGATCSGRVSHCSAAWTIHCTVAYGPLYVSTIVYE